jgi:uncharacterized membrane protein
MESQGRKVHIDRDEARAGSTPGVVRYVLMIGLALVVLAFAIIVITGSLNANQETNNQADSERAAAEQQQQSQQ